jgi:hypothetical protein
MGGLRSAALIRFKSIAASRGLIGVATAAAPMINWADDQGCEAIHTKPPTRSRGFAWPAQLPWWARLKNEN